MSYGKSNEKTSFFYDPLFTMSITISGELSLMMLAERLMNINHLTMLQINTDGLTIKIKKSDYDAVKEVCRWWMKITKLELEEAIYSKMIIRDVNCLRRNLSNCGKLLRA